MAKPFDIHTIAERYLRDLERGNVSFYAPPDNTEVVPLADTITERVVVQREEAPQYFVGFKASGRPVWSHDIKLAASYDSCSLGLVKVLSVFKIQKTAVETWPAAWFSNHQRDAQL